MARDQGILVGSQYSATCDDAKWAGFRRGGDEGNVEVMAFLDIPSTYGRS